MYFGRKRKYAAKLRAQERKKPSRIISLLLVISMLCGNFVGMHTVAAEMVAYCGMEEHTHSEACYCAVRAEGEAAAETLAAAVPTEETAAETTEETTAPTEETALSVSGGSEAQALIGEYVEKELCCGMEEHKHSIACYANPLADLETAAIWEATLPEKLSGDWGKDLAEVAKSQLGYAESAANYLVGADGETLMGYSRYGAWYSSYTQDEKQAYADWNVPFLFFCLYYAGVEDFPIEEDCADWTAALAAAELWREAAGEYIPEAGDLVFLDTDDDGTADRAAVVTDWDEAEVTAVESDSEGVVKTVTYDLTEDTQVLGYGDTNEAQTQIEVSGGEDAPQLMSNTTFTIYFAAPQSWSEYKVKYEAVLGDNGSTKDSAEMQPTGETYTSANGTKYNIYKAENVYEKYGGFDELYFHKYEEDTWKAKYTVTTSWLTKETMENKMWLPNSIQEWDTNTEGGDWIEYVPAEEPDVDEVTELPEVASGKRRVFYDATLSKLSYDGDSGSKGDYGIPKADSNVIYCWADQRYVMTKLASYTSGGHTYTDVYYVDIPSTCTTVTFASFALTSATNYGWSGESTTNLTIPGDYEQPCFYANSSDDSIYNSYDGNRRGGYWGEAFTVRDPGTVVDIPTATRENTADTLYLNTTFYDYYTDFELNGNNRDNYSTDASKTTDRIYQPFRHFNQALSSYYSGINASNPLYWGNFQNYSGDHFDEIAGTLNLYGYSDNKNKFFAENNSMWGYDGGELTNNDKDGAQATMGLVSNELTNGNLMIKTSSGSAIAPYFSKSFLEGGNSKNTVLGKVYENVSFPFTKEALESSSDQDATGTVDYWVFDSRDTTLRLKEDSTDGYWLDSTDVSDVYGSTPDENSTSDKNFFPFNSEDQSAKSQQLNYGFATKLELKFRLTEDGTVKTTENKDVPIEFNFSGDDDVWVFIDGKLALDVGGGHGRVAGYLNFQNKTYLVDRVKDSSSGVVSDKTGTFEMIGDNTDEHTLTMFYMERGLWESNMRITFNFPDENQLEVEKEVDLGNVNEIFKDSFKNQKLFTFNIKNLATHFADVAAKGETHDPISWNVAGSTLRKDPSNTFSIGTYQERSNALHWFAQYDDGASQYRHKRYGVLSLPDTIDITNMAKLSFDVFVEGVSSFSLSDMYLQILDEDAEIGDLVDSTLTAGNDNAMGCISSSLSGKTYGTPSTQGGTWVTITLDLSKLDKADGFDKTRVKHLRFGYNYPNNIYLSNITFLPAAQQSNPTGFITQQYDVPSYGSATSGELEPAAGAVYTSNIGTAASHVVDSDGQFVLENGELINFHDQFRRGSYIYLEEVQTAREKALYDTTWTMYENDTEVGTFGTGTTVTNPTTTPSMVGVESNVVTDQRVEYYQTTDTSGKDPTNAYKGGSNPGGFVFRSYANPDSTATTTKLRVKFTNTVNVGSLTIMKTKAGDTSLTGSFTFYVRFYNVGGISLESSTVVVGPISLSQGQSYTISGIPLNTQYSIYEIKPDESTHITLDHATYAGSTISHVNTVYGGNDAYRVTGTISNTGNHNVTFYNIYKPVVSLAVTKLWKDGQGNDITTDLPTSITVQLQRSQNGTSWSFVTDPTITPGYSGWTDPVYTFEDLDKYVDHTATNRVAWQYRVVETNGSGNVVADGGTFTVGTGDNAVEYTVTYGESKQGTDGNWSQTITNTQDSKISLELTKNWVNADNTTFDPGNLPDSIKVQLQRRPSGSTNAGDWTPVLYQATGVTTDETKKTVTIYKPTENLTSWSFTFEDLEKSSDGTDWEYRVVEFGTYSTIANGERLGNYLVSYTVENGSVAAATAVSSTDDNLEQTITNAYDPIDITVQKAWENTDDTKRNPITVKLQQKVIGSSEDFEDMQGKTVELKKENNWTAVFTGLPLVTNDGTLYEYNVVEVGETNNYMVHDNILFKVSYSDFTTDTNSNKSMTITNTAQTVTVNILKKATGTNNPLSGVTFLLEKQGTDGNYSTVDSQTTRDDGKVTFSGLCIGVYKLTETKTHDGYNLLASPIIIEITVENNAYVVSVNGESTGFTFSDNNLAFDVYNKPQLQMPPTGGVGGFEFWILGGLLIMAVPLLMYTFIWYRKGGKYLQR